MRYRTKLFLCFVLVVAISTFTALAIIYQGTHRLVLNQIRSEMLSISETSSSFINGDEIQQFQKRSDMNTSAYKALIHQLRELRNLQRRSDIFIKYLYIIRKVSPGHYIFVADAEEDPKEVSLFGDPTPLEPQFVHKIGSAPFVTPAPYTDEWGTWFTSYTPIYDSQEKVVGVLGMDVSTHDIHIQLSHLLAYGMMALIGALLFSTLVAYLLAKIVTSSLTKICAAIDTIREGDLTIRLHLNTKDEFQDLAVAINQMAQNVQEKERLTVAFGRYVSHHVLQTILESNQPTNLEGERKKVTILFCDIHQFTLIAEVLSPEIVVSLLNQYLKKMISIIFSHQGTLDKFVGDGIMAEFGVPLEDPLQELHAVRAAIDMEKMVPILSQEWKQHHQCDISIGIGIHTGLAIVGNIGSNIRMEYTAIGDTVNVASRIEKATKTLSVTILISGETYKNIPTTDEFQCKDLGEIILEGRERPIRAYAILPTHKSEDRSS